MAANPHTKPNNLCCESTGRLLLSTSTIAIYYCAKADTHFTIPWRVEGRVNLGICWCPLWILPLTTVCLYSCTKKEVRIIRYLLEQSWWKLSAKLRKLGLELLCELLRRPARWDLQTALMKLSLMRMWPNDLKQHVCVHMICDILQKISTNTTTTTTTTTTV